MHGRLQQRGLWWPAAAPWVIFIGLWPVLPMGHAGHVMAPLVNVLAIPGQAWSLCRRPSRTPAEAVVLVALAPVVADQALEWRSKPWRGRAAMAYATFNLAFPVG